MGINTLDILTGLLMGMAYVAAPGPIIVETLRQGMRGGLRASLAVQGGSALGPLLYGGLALLGAGALLQQATWRPLLALGGMFILVYLGISTIRDSSALAAPATTPAPAHKSTRGALGIGAILSLANPLDIVFWLSIGAAAMQRPGTKGDAFFVAFVAGCITASLLAALVAAFWQSRLSARALRALSLACGVGLIGFGLHLGLSATVQAAPDITVNGLTFTVNNNGDAPDLTPGDLLCDTDATLPGQQCSLRAAIEEVNAQSPLNTHGIIFKIPAGPAPIVIKPASPLPFISRPVVIDGASQSGASCPTAKATGTLRIVLDGSNVVGSPAEGLSFGSSGGGAVRGLAIGNFATAGIVLGINSSGYLIECNY
ncbi:MAG: LysE family transporter, partial [Chloroflexota bacterium]